MKRYLGYLALIVLACAWQERPAFAQASVLGSSFPIYAASSRGSAVAYDTKNHVYLVVSAYGAVNARFVTADGVLLPTCISSGTSFILGGAAFAHFPRVAYSPDANGGLGGFMVTWHEADSVTGGNAVHARAVSYSGCAGVDRIISNTVDGNGTVIAGDKSWWEAGAAISYSPASQRYLVAWRSISSLNDGQTAYSPDDINARLLDLSGQPLGLTPIKVTSSALYEDNPSIAYNPSTNQFLVSFAGYDTSAFIASRTLSAATGALGPQYELSRASGTYITDATFINSTGRFLVAWFQLPGGSTGRLVNGSSGIPEGSVIPLSTRFMANDAMSVAYNAVSDTSFMVSHDQLTIEDGGLEISAAGVPGPGFGATNAGGAGNYYPRIAASSVSKQWLMVTSNSFLTIYGQFIQTGSSGGGGGGGGTPPPSQVQVTGLTPNVALPVPEGTAITWTAATTGGTAPIQYQFVRYTDGLGWSVAQPYSTNNTYTWFPSAGTHALQVWVKSAGSSNAYDAYLSTGMFTILDPAPKLTSLTSNVAFPVSLGVPVTFTASATGGPGPLQYKFLRYSSSTGWTVGQDYSTSSSFVWYPPSGTNAVQVWVRAAGSSAAYQDYMTTGLFGVAGSPAKLTGVVANVNPPIATSTTVTWTASATGGSGPLEYKFFRYDLGANAWSVLRDWGASNQASWTPGVGNSGWQALQVWVRTAGSSSAFEDFWSTGYFLVTDSTELNLTPNRSLTGLRVGDLVAWTANVAPAGSWEYQFVTFDGSSWKVQQPYTASQNTFVWFPPAGTVALQVWIRAAGSHATWERYQTTGMFVVNP